MQELDVDVFLQIGSAGGSASSSSAATEVRQHHLAAQRRLRVSRCDVVSAASLLIQLHLLVRAQPLTDTTALFISCRSHSNERPNEGGPRDRV